MAGFRHSSETGEREFVEDGQPVEQPQPREPGWVEMFLAPNEHGFPLRTPHRSPGPRNRGYRRKSLRR